MTIVPVIAMPALSLSLTLTHFLVTMDARPLIDSFVCQQWQSDTCFFRLIVDYKKCFALVPEPVSEVIHLMILVYNESVDREKEREMDALSRGDLDHRVAVKFCVVFAGVLAAHCTSTRVT